MSPYRLLPLLVLLSLSACRVGSDEADPDEAAATVNASESQSATALGGDVVPSNAEVDASRYVGRGRATSVDTAAIRRAAASNPESLEGIDSTRSWSGPLHLPLGGDVSGPSVVKAQTLLDRAGFSPGEIDGQWGDNTELAVTWFQKSADLPATGLIDEATARALAEHAGRPQELVVAHRLTEEDVAGPFVDIPEDVYEKAELDRLGYESLSEKLGERFHAAPELLARLNEGAPLDSLAAGDTLRVPNVRNAPRPQGTVSRLVISGGDGYLHALADDGRVLMHAPVTVGASYDPSPEGDFSVVSVTRNPSWHYQPALLENVPDNERDATLPPGPNNAVGTVWMALSKEHYGIHGTRAPGTIGYASSAGCVRLTNWDAEKLAGMVRGGTPVRFRDVSGREGSPSDSTGSARPSA